MAIQALKQGYRLNEFEIRRTVGAGGFGIVYEAWDYSLSRIVAIKEYMPTSLASRAEGATVHVISDEHASVFSKGMSSFINEAKTLAQFDHPALLRVYRFWEQNGTAYMVMPYYRGSMLKDMVRNHPELINEDWLKRILSSLLDVLAFLHNHDCFHRDIAPDNVFILENGNPVLLDFGASRKIIGEEEDIQTIILKPGYAPVEQYAEDGSMPQGAWTDIYALAAVTYFAMTGKAPPSSVVRAVQDPLEPLEKQALPGYSAQFLKGLDQGLQLNPRLRPATTEEFRKMLGVPQSDFYAQAATRYQTVSVAAAKNTQENSNLEDADKTRIFVFENNAEAARPVETIAPSAQQGSRQAVPNAQKNSTHTPASTKDHEPEPATVTVAESEEAVTPEQPVLEKEKPEKPGLLQTLGQTLREKKTPDLIKTFLAWLELRIPKEKNLPVAVLTGIASIVILVGALVLWPVDTPRENNLDENNAMVASPDEISGEDTVLTDFNATLAVQEVIEDTDKAAWQRAMEAATLEAIHTYLRDFPDGRYAALAQKRVSDMVTATLPLPDLDETAWEKAEKKATPDAFSDYLRQFPKGKYAAAAKHRLVKEPPLQTSGQPTETDIVVTPEAKSKDLPVSLRIKPWGVVRVDGKERGISPPLKQIMLPVGVHMIEIENTSFATREIEFVVKEGEDNTLVVEF
jgi:serine/threonine protein kinase